MTATTNTFGSTIGALIGKSAAYAAHGAVRTAQGTGRFGQDVLAGTVEGYTSKAEELKAVRMQLAARREKPIAITVTSSRKRAVTA